MVGRPVAELGSLLPPPLQSSSTDGGMAGRTKRRLRDLTSEKFVAARSERDAHQDCPFERVRECGEDLCVGSFLRSARFLL